MHTTDKLAANIIAAILFEHGVRNVIVSPGTRNAPLIMALDSTQEYRIQTVIDERCAAFFALGIALQTSSPVALVCTSGTAVLNYAPAVAEAYYRGVPLIVISADRPLRTIDQGEGQTIHQCGALANFVRGSFDIPSDESIRDFQWYVNYTVNRALLTATGANSGPVHINVQLDTPLSGIVDIESSDVCRRVIRVLPIDPYSATMAQIRRIAAPMIGKRIAVVIGTHNPDSKLNKALLRLSQLPNVAIFVEAQSNIRGVPRAVTSIDAWLSLLTSSQLISLAPEYVITIGGDVVSPMLKTWLRDIENLRHWHIGPTDNHRLVDTYHHLELSLDVNPAHFFNGLLSVLNPRHSDLCSNISSQSHFANDVDKVNMNLHQLTHKYIDMLGWCDFKAVWALIDNLPAETNLHISNSMAIRYAQLFNHCRLHRIDSNRGTNGIDGSTSTAIGAAVMSHRPTVLLTGDMAFLYDLNALNTLPVPANFVIIVLNNGGGDIFRVIANTRHLPIRESHLTVSPQRDYQSISDAFGFEFLPVESYSALKDFLNGTKRNKHRPLLVELRTFTEKNSQVYNDYFEYLRQNSQK